MRFPERRRELEARLQENADPKRAEELAWFFKTGKGQYGEGDIFLGIRVPVLRKMALLYRDLPESELARLLASPIHDHRFVALEILVAQYERGAAAERDNIYRFYLTQTARINNWDLVDTSAPYIVGEHLKSRSRAILRRLARSKNVWERRIAIVSTLAFIKVNDTSSTFVVADLLLEDRHDLIHKAVGWALREAGKVDSEALREYLLAQYDRIPRTALRYAIERFPPDHRKRLLAGDWPNSRVNTL